ncbi:MAG TPA: family 20 glycosylhydrolase, partial [Terriglobales bacterium]|nr:family 20 glycosylhydrolase [Terriglobales bacterium]
MRTMLVVLAMYSLAVFAEAQNAPLNLMPMPASIKMGAGQLVVDPSFSIAISGHKEPRLQRAVEIFLNDLRRQDGMLPLDMKISNSSTSTLLIHVESGTKGVQELGEDESYRLEITTSGAKLNAPTTLGVMRGLQTFLQLVETTPAGFAAPAVIIDDKPRFPWRGLMIDCGRHFMPLDVIKRNLDGMAAVKLNVFHWHLSENQG